MNFVCFCAGYEKMSMFTLQNTCHTTTGNVSFFCPGFELGSFGKNYQNSVYITLRHDMDNCRYTIMYSS